MAQPTTYPASDAQAPDNATASTHELSRRTFLIRTLCAGGVLAAGTTLAPGKAQADILDFLSKLYDFNPVVLNFAHEMEELQAEFFERASVSRAGKMLEPRARNLIYEIAAQDRAHFEFLDELTQLQATRNGGTMRTRQASASRRPRMFTFPAGAFENKEMLLPAAIELKELTVSAYHGAVHLITSNLLTPAAAIAGVDGRHLAILREVAGLDPVPFSFENQVSAQTIGKKLARYGFKGGKQQEG